VARIELLADSVTEERIAQVAFAQPPAGVSVGEMAEVTLQLPATTPALLLPNAAIQRQQGQTGVWRLSGDRPEFAPVTLGQQSLDGQVQVLSGLSKDDRVVIYSEKALKSGARVSVVDALTSAGAKP
jgi:HlyD family secretion protein